MTELRCDSGILHAVLTDEGYLEVKCRSNRCGKERGVVVIHRFNAQTGNLIETRRFQEPKGEHNGTTE